MHELQVHGQENDGAEHGQAECKGTERKVDGEDPAPGQVVDEESAQQWAADACQREHGTEVTLITTTFAWTDNVGHDRQREGEQTAGAQALYGAECDQLTD